MLSVDEDSEEEEDLSESEEGEEEEDLSESEEGEMLKADEDALRAIRAASTALQERWPEGESPRSWHGVTWSGDRVRELNLYDSGLEVLPPQIGQLTALTKLSLAGCPLNKLPPQIGQLTALTKLELQWCQQLKELPPQIGQLTALTKLYLIGCEQLKGLPPQIGQLLALTNLNLVGCNQLTLAPGAAKGQPVQTIVAAYARLLIVEPRKDGGGAGGGEGSGSSAKYPDYKARESSRTSS